VRRVDQHRAGARAEGGLQLGGVHGEVGRSQRDETRHRARHGQARPVGVVVGLEDHDLLSGLDQPEEARRQGLGAAAGHRHLGVGIDAVAAVGAEAVGDRPVQVRDSEHPGVLAVALADGRDGGLLDELGAVEVGEPLAEVDGVVLQRQAAHLGEDRGAERCEAVGDLWGSRCGMALGAHRGL
jgi:hypothetical protein